MSASERRPSSSELIVRLLGVGVVALAVWLALATNVDTDAETGPTNCGPNAVRVLARGPSVNRSALSSGDCRQAAVVNLGLCVLLGAIGVAAATAGSSAVRRWGRAGGRQVFTSVPQVVLNSAAVAMLALLAVGGLFELSDALGLGSLPLGALLLARTLRLGVVIDDRVVTVRNVLRTRRVPLQEAVSFEIVPTPWWVGRVQEWVVVRTVDDRQVPITVLALPVFVSFQGPARRRVGAMNDALQARQRAAGQPAD